MQLKKAMAASVIAMALTACDKEESGHQSSVNIKCSTADGQKHGVAKIAHTGRGAVALFDENISFPEKSADKKALSISGSFNNDSAQKFVEDYCRTGEVGATADAGVKSLREYIRIKDDASKGVTIQSNLNGYEQIFVEIAQDHEVTERAYLQTDKPDFEGADHFIKTGEVLSPGR